ncbi:hypothetical protein HDU91_000449, partial [Kappamyces sp. JEL0680]
APMFGYSGHQLVAACCEQGMLGSLAHHPPEQLELEIVAIRRQTQKPFAVNLFLLPPALSQNQPGVPASVSHVLQDFRRELQMDLSTPKPGPSHPSAQQEFNDQIDILVKHKVACVIFTFGIPDRVVVDRLHASGMYLIGSATTIDEALAYQHAGMDAVVLQGIEAGGHRTTPSLPHSYGQHGLLSLLTLAKSRLAIPYIAAGGLVSFQSIKACLDLGASACSLGSAFLLASECKTPPSHRSALVQASLDPRGPQTVLSRAYTGRPARMLPNRFYTAVTKALDGNETLLPWNYNARDIFGAATAQDRHDLFIVWSGQSGAFARESAAAADPNDLASRSVARIVQDLQLHRLV